MPALAAKATVARSTIAAWGGVAGAANAAQATLTASGYSPKQTVAAQRAYVSNINKVLDGLKDVQTGPDEAIFLLKLRFTCRIALPITDAEDSPLLDD